MLIPNSGGHPEEFDFVRLAERGFCRKPQGPGGGQFSHSGTGKCDFKSSSSKLDNDDRPYEGGRPVPIKVSSVKEAIKLILQGKVVEVSTVKKVSTILTKLAKMALRAQELGEKAPHFDLCKVTVAGTNLFCEGRLRTKEHPEGIPRIHMPQIAGTPRKGSKADKLPRREGKDNQVDGAKAFLDHLKSRGINTSKEKVPSSSLRATQSELIGTKVAKMMAKSYDPKARRIFISRDNYVVDGHHHWAAQVGRDAKSGKLKRSRMRVVRIDAPISELLQMAQKWTKKFGIISQAAA